MASTILRAGGLLQRHQLRLRSLSTSKNWDYDVVVVGGGVVGAALACKLAQTPSMSGTKILVVETFPPPPLATAVAESRAIDVRTYAMTAASTRFLDSVGAWQPIVQAGRTSPYDSLQIWSNSANEGKTSSNFIHFDAYNHGAKLDGNPNPNIGTIIEHTTVQAALFEQMSRLHTEGKLELRCPAKVEKITFDERSVSSSQGANPARLLLKSSVPKTNLAKNELDGESSSSSKPDEQEEIMEEVSARLVIAADGAQSPTRKAAGIGTWGWNYDQKAVICTVDVGENGLKVLSKSSDDSSGAGLISIQRFLPTGPMALLPLWHTPNLTKTMTKTDAQKVVEKESSGRNASLIWSTTPNHAQYLTSLSDEDFVKEINEAFQSSKYNSSSKSSGDSESTNTTEKGLKGVLSSIGSIGKSVLNTSLSAAQLAGDRGFEPAPQVVDVKSKRFAIDLNYSMASTYAKWRIALVGDAAHSMHPMAGQGLNMGIADAEALAKAIDQTARAGLDIGDPQNFLGDYAKDRYRDNLFMATSIDFLHRVFGLELGKSKGGPLTISDLPKPIRDLIVNSRDIGLASINALPPLKTLIVKYAMGKSD